MRKINRRSATVLVAGAALLLSLGTLASSAQASTTRHPAPPAPTAPVTTPAPAPASTLVTGAVTNLGSNFSAGGYLSATYTVKTTAAATFTVSYSTDIAGSAVNTTIDGVGLRQVSVAAGAPVSTDSFTLSAGTHTIKTQSPDGYGTVSIDLVRAG